SRPASAGPSPRTLASVTAGTHPPLQPVGRRIGEARMAVAGRIQIEQRRAVIRAVELVRYGLINRHGHRSGGRVAFVAAVDRDGLASHTLSRVGVNVRGWLGEAIVVRTF